MATDPHLTSVSPQQPPRLPSPPPPVVFSAPSSPRTDAPPTGSAAAATSSPSSPSSPTQQPARSTALFSSVSSSALFNRTHSAKQRSLRRQSTQDRLDDILKTARHRAETYSAAEAASSSAAIDPSNNTTRRTTYRMEPLLRNQPAPGAFAGIAEQYESESADETTHINQSGSPRNGRRSNPNYQSTATTTSTYGSVSSPVSAAQSSSGPRARKYTNDQAGAGSASAAGGGGRADTTSRAAPVRSRQNTAVAGGGGAGSSSTGSSAWKDFWAGFQSIELENKGSVARDHLALERTFLAWLRTSLAFASIGIAVTQLFRLNTSTENDNENDSLNSLQHVGRPLGTTFLGISVLILFLGYHRYYQSQQWILKGKFPASRGTILVVSLVAFALMVTSLVVVVVVHPS
ncbi:hypothetical protein SCUCBS95973_008888 [Sporothrix curviconia]|uniref:DUF202 domain-containing protein n=1 Tax=Sporothrix curviconia TaxID=1260050 RepID=A0ABP0CRY6_9PEZI